MIGRFKCAKIHFSLFFCPGSQYDSWQVETAVKVEEKRFVERGIPENLLLIQHELGFGDPFCEERGQLRIAQDALRRFDVAGRSVRSSISRIFSTGTSSLSKAMLSATSCGIASFRIRSLRSDGRDRQSRMFSSQFISGNMLVNRL